MRWRRRARRDAVDAAPVGSSTGYQPGSWGQAVAPPPAPAPHEAFSAPTGNVEVIQAPAAPAPPPAPAVEPPPPPLIAPPVAAPEPSPPAPVSATPAPLSSSEAAPQEDAASGVRLGFADGSDLHLDPDHPHSLALKAIADVLLHRGPFHRRVS